MFLTHFLSLSVISVLLCVKIRLCLICCLVCCFQCDAASSQKLACLYNSLDQQSVAQHLAFYELYPDTPEGKRALGDSWKLLQGSNSNSQFPLPLPLSISPLQAVISLVNKQPNATAPDLNDDDLTLIEHLSQNLANRKLRGHAVSTEAQVLALSNDEIDLSRALFLAQFGETHDAYHQLRNYEAAIDLMALQIRAKLPSEVSNIDKIRAINNFIFYDMGFRFPPHSIYAKEIDLYTFLPSVMDSRRGVCLGVSILYLCLAQRLDLPLEIVTPPGHIYVRYRDGKQIVNIETTARGVHVDCEEYLNIDTCKLQERQIKEVVGMAYCNQAAALVAHNRPQDAITCYEHALLYQPDDMQLKEFMGYSCLLAGDEHRGRRLIEQIVNYVPDYSLSSNTAAEDYLAGHADAEGFAAILMHVDESRTSVLEKLQRLQATVERCPKFRGAYFALASAWMQLHRQGEALAALERLHALDDQDPTTEYYLATLYAERFDYPKAWKHLKQAEQITAKKNYSPQALKKLHSLLLN